MLTATLDDPLAVLIERWKADPGGAYRSWFLWEERLKNFRSIRRGLTAVVREIEAGSFGNTYRGSSLEVVVASVAEQRQIFKGADHAFLWKPKLRIPDIYENADNQRAFARLLHTCECCDTAEAVIEAIHRIDAMGIKGLGPAVANLLYFIHPTLVVPFNRRASSGCSSNHRWAAGVTKMSPTFGVLDSPGGKALGIWPLAHSNRASPSGVAAETVPGPMLPRQ